MYQVVQSTKLDFYAVSEKTTEWRAVDGIGERFAE